MNDARPSNHGVSQALDHVPVVNIGINQSSQVDGQTNNATTFAMRRKKFHRKSQTQPSQTKNATMKNEIAALTREIRLLRKESGRVYDLLQKSSKIVEPTGNDLGSVNIHSSPKQFDLYCQDKHESALLKGLAMDEERYRNIKNDILDSGLLEGRRMMRLNTIILLDRESISTETMADAFIMERYRDKVWPKSIILSEIDAAWPRFDERDFHSGQLVPDFSLLRFSNLKYLVELDPRTSSATVSSSSNTSESETAEPTRIGFVVECFNTMNYWDDSEGRTRQAPLDFRTITAIAGLLTPPRAEAREAQHDAEHRNSLGVCHLEFILGYLSPWEYVYRHANVRELNDETLWCVYHIRWFTCPEGPYPVKYPHKRFIDGILPEREVGSFLDGRSGQRLELTERRFCLYLLCPIKASSKSEYVLVRVVDVGSIGVKADNENDARHEFKLLNCLRWPGIAEFQFSIFRILQGWYNDWMALLDRIDGVVRVKSMYILQKESRQDLMYDDEQLSQSETYFSILQLFRVWEETITQTKRHLGDLTNMCQHQLNISIQYSHNAPEEEAAIAIIAENWKTVTYSFEGYAQTLLERMNHKTGEIKSLRDALFNAQSVREATKATRMNQYLFIFTIVTILYLPPTFAATFFGMHLFDGENGPTEWTQETFWKVFGGVTGVTYLLAAVALMGVRRQRAAKAWLLSKAQRPYLAILYCMKVWIKLLELARSKLSRSARAGNNPIP
ncbi:hypothetical protein F5X98DRAFT_353354 [Xylaria grammica]|nr:hypothetical protein F5X98DRAFT_353354 [Xylaria grammica]